MAWIQARLAAGQLPGLLSDYGYVGALLSQQIARALRRPRTSWPLRSFLRIQLPRGSKAVTCSCAH
jgi:hypothetical protein